MDCPSEENLIRMKQGIARQEYDLEGKVLCFAQTKNRNAQ